MKRLRKIDQELAMVDRRLSAAEAYVARGENVEGRSWLHLDDWKGRSGHPLWMKNHMIPATERARARKMKALERIGDKSKERALTDRKRASNTGRGGLGA